MKLSKERYEEVERKLEVFGFGQLQTTLTFLDLLEFQKISPEEVKSFVEMKRGFVIRQREYEKNFRKAQQEQWNKNTRGCPTCMMPLMARGISTPKGKGNMKGYTCLWFCQEEDCKFEEYTHEDFKKVYQKIMGGR